MADERQVDRQLTLAALRIARASLWVMVLTLIVALGAWFVPGPLGALRPQWFYGLSSEKLVQVETTYGSSRPSMPFCFRSLDAQWQGDDYFRTYYLWGYARAQPEDQWSFFQRQVTVQRVDFGSIPQWRMLRETPWTRTDTDYYMYIDPGQHLRLWPSEIKALGQHCGAAYRINWPTDEELAQKAAAATARVRRDMFRPVLAVWRFGYTPLATGYRASAFTNSPFANMLFKLFYVGIVIFAPGIVVLVVSKVRHDQDVQFRHVPAFSVLIWLTVGIVWFMVAVCALFVVP